MKSIGVLQLSHVPILKLFMKKELHLIKVECFLQQNYSVRSSSVNAFLTPISTTCHLSSTNFLYFEKNVQ